MSLAIVGGVEGVPDGDAGAVALRALLRVRSDMMGITEGHERMADMEIESERTEIEIVPAARFNADDLHNSQQADQTGIYRMEIRKGTDRFSRGRYLESGGRFREKDNCGTNGIGKCNGDIGRSIGRR